jgi:hypothetical protein
MTFEDPLFQPPPRSTACAAGMPSAGFALAHHDERRRRVESAAIPL